MQHKYASKHNEGRWSIGKSPVIEMRFGVVLVLNIVLIVWLTKVNAQLLFSTCQNDIVHPPNTTFSINRDAVLASLVSNATAPSGFYNTTVGSSDAADSTVHGTFFCRGDITPTQCRNCVSQASDVVRQRCPGARAAGVWEDFCTLRYSNESFFSKLSLEPTFNMSNPYAIPDQERFNEAWKRAAMELKDEIVKGTAGVGYGKRLFGTKATVFTPLQTFRTLAQCSPDLSAQDCDLCLNASIAWLPSCCLGRHGGRVIKPSCNIRTESYSFYTDPPFLAPPSDSSSPPEPDVQSADPVAATGDGGLSRGVIAAVVVPLTVGASVVVVAAWYCCLSRWRRNKSGDASEQNGGHLMDDNSLQFSFDTIQEATKSFSLENKIGEGGFGEVFLGVLSNGTQIAVKRLSECSRHGVQEFKNEVLLVAKLQHRNLVRLLGFCVEGSERILIYDFIPNKSLDRILFDPKKHILLDWPQRYTIIHGIARGMLYLHEDSPLKIIHRDLKAANILLDDNMNPKISDFGTARIVDVNESRINTKRVVGTFGYMPPEYVRHGQFSAKSDVFSFGVLVLEIITARKRVNFQSDEAEDLLSRAWKTWMKGSPLDLLDPSVGDKYPRNEVLKCIHMALLCVQENMSHRPTMQTIMLMLNSSSVSMPRPQQPTYYL